MRPGVAFERDGCKTCRQRRVGGSTTEQSGIALDKSADPDFDEGTLAAFHVPLTKVLTVSAPSTLTIIFRVVSVSPNGA